MRDLAFSLALSRYAGISPQIPILKEQRNDFLKTPMILINYRYVSLIRSETLGGQSITPMAHYALWKRTNFVTLHIFFTEH